MINFLPIISLSKTTNYHLIWSYRDNTVFMETYEISGLSSLPIPERQFSCHLHFTPQGGFICNIRVQLSHFLAGILFFKPKVNLLHHLAPSESDLTSIFRRTFNRLCDFKHFQVRFIRYNVKPNVLNFTFLTEVNCKNACKYRQTKVKQSLHLLIIRFLPH